MTTFNPLDQISRNFVGFWFDAEGSEVSKRVFSTVGILRMEQRYISERYRRAMQLYENIILPIMADGYEAGWQYGGWDNGLGPYGLNIVESVVDTIHAEIISNRIRVQFLTDGGSWEAQQKAKQLTKFNAGVFDDVGMYSAISPIMAQHALIFGDAFAKVYVDQAERLQLCSVFPANIVFDDVEAANGYMSAMNEERFVSRHTLAREFMHDKVAYSSIINAPEVTFPRRYNRSVGDLIRVVESWQPAYGDSDGRHVLCVSPNEPPVIDKPYKGKKPPFIHLTYKKRLRSILGTGVPEIIQGQQEVINDLREKINAQIMGASPFVWAPTGARLKECELSNEIWRVIESDQPPQHIAFASVPQDLFVQVDKEMQEAMSMVGVNQTMMRGEIPAGISGSGRAQLVYNDTKSKRFTRFAQAYEQMHVDTAEMFIDTFEELADAGAGYRTGYRDDSGLEEINYKEIRLPKDSFYIRKYPTNFLSDTPAGRIAQIESLANLSPEIKPYLVSLLQNPDIEFATSRLSVQSSAAQRIAERLLTTDVMPGDNPPTPEMELEQAMGIFKNYIVDAESRNVPPERVQKCRDWLVMAQMMLESATPAPAQLPAQLPQPGMPSEAMGPPPPEAGPPASPVP